MFFVYILRNPQNKLYIGCANNVEKRLQRHNAGRGAQFTRLNKNFELVYEEKYQTLLEARRREKRIKSWKREKKEDLIKFGNQIIKD